MAFNVRLFGYRGIKQIKSQQRQFTADSVFLLDEPFIWGEVVSVSAAAAISTAHSGGENDKVTILRVEVPNAEAVRYRIIPANWTVEDADTECPYLSGQDQFDFHPGWRISLIDAAGLP